MSTRTVSLFFLSQRRCCATAAASKGRNTAAAANSQLRQIGIGYKSQKIKDCVISAVGRHSSVNSVMTDLDVLLFDVHDTYIPEELLKRQVNSLTIFETSQQYRQQMKTFASSKTSAGGNSVAAYRSSLHNLLSRSECSTFIKLLEEKRGIEKKPHIIRQKEDSNDESQFRARGPIIVATLPALSQQKALIERFRDSLLEHVCSGVPHTLYQFGDTRLITFLPAELFVQLICAVPNYSDRLEFMSRKQKHSSAVFNTLFKLDVLNDGRGFSTEEFVPGIPEKTEKISRDARLREMGIHSGMMYGLSITPKSSISFGNLSFLTHGTESDSLLKFVFWMNKTGTLKKSDQLNEMLRSWFPQTSSLSNCQVKDLSATDFVDLFEAALPNMRVERCSQEFLKEYKEFADSFETGSSEEEYFD